MVHSGGGRLDPPQPAAADHAVPIDRDLGVPAEDVGVEKLLGDPLLAGIDHLGPRHGGGDLGDVFRFDGVAKDDAHGVAHLGHGYTLARSASEGNGWLATTGRIVPVPRRPRRPCAGGAHG